MIRHAVLISTEEQEGGLQGDLPGVHAFADCGVVEGDEVLFRRVGGLDPPGFFAAALVKGIDRFNAEGVVMRFTPLTHFQMVLDPPYIDRVLPAIRAIPHREFAELVDAGGDLNAFIAERHAAFAEEGDSFEHEEESGAFDERLVAGWGRCPFIGAPLEDAAIFVLPVASGVREKRRGSAIAVCREVAEALETGALSVGPDGGLVVLKSRIDPELEERLLPSGRLLEPLDPIWMVPARRWAWHRRLMFARDWGIV